MFFTEHTKRWQKESAFLFVKANVLAFSAYYHNQHTQQRFQPTAVVCVSPDEPKASWQSGHLQAPLLLANICYYMQNHWHVPSNKKVMDSCKNICSFSVMQLVASWLHFRMTSIICLFSYNQRTDQSKKTQRWHNNADVLLYLNVVKVWINTNNFN